MLQEILHFEENNMHSITYKQGKKYLKGSTLDRPF